VIGTRQKTSTESIKKTFHNVLAVDVDPNACQATLLSLSLLHLVVTETFPEELRVQNREAVGYFKEHNEFLGTFDAVLANPPYTKWNDLFDDWKRNIQAYMSDTEGKIGLYIAVLKVGLDLVKPGGYVLYVLPHSFLIDEAAGKLREEIHQHFWVRILADLHNIPVFGDVGSYVILLILQRKLALFKEGFDNPPGIIVRCTDFLGRALQKALEGERTKTDFYDIFEADQRQFGEPRWYILDPQQMELHAKLQNCPKLEDFMFVRKGFITGRNRVFIRNRGLVPPGEQEIYRPYLSDREMLRYAVPDETAKVIFYPFVEGRRILKDELVERFPRTWEHLTEYEETLKDRPSVIAGNVQWWSPERPRSPTEMFRPKIVSPHLILYARFSLDIRGVYAVSQCPMLYPKKSGDVLGMLRFFVAILNSSVANWQIASQTQKYERNYSMLESHTLRLIRVPDPLSVDPSTMKKIQELVAGLMSDSTELQLDAQVDRLVADVFGLSKGERAGVGMHD
jgi:hypothetical protein